MVLSCGVDLWLTEMGPLLPLPLSFPSHSLALSQCIPIWYAVGTTLRKYLTRARPSAQDHRRAAGHWQGMGSAATVAAPCYQGPPRLNTALLPRLPDTPPSFCRLLYLTMGCRFHLCFVPAAPSPLPCPCRVQRQRMGVRQGSLASISPYAACHLSPALPLHRHKCSAGPQAFVRVSLPVLFVANLNQRTKSCDRCAVTLPRPPPPFLPLPPLPPAREICS